MVTTKSGGNHPSPMTPDQRKTLQASFDSFMKGGGLAGNRVWDGFAALDAALSPPKQGGGGGASGGNKPGNPAGPNKPAPTPQWTFQPNAYDQSPYGAAGAQGAAGPGPASQYTVHLPTQPWMLNPMGQAPQPQPPQDQQSLQYYQQWAPPYRT